MGFSEAFRGAREFETSPSLLRRSHGRAPMLQSSSAEGSEYRFDPDPKFHVARTARDRDRGLGGRPAVSGPRGHGRQGRRRGLVHLGTPPPLQEVLQAQDPTTKSFEGLGSTSGTL